MRGAENAFASLILIVCRKNLSISMLGLRRIFVDEFAPADFVVDCSLSPIFREMSIVEFDGPPSW